jgi:hypothetical protein
MMPSAMEEYEREIEALEGTVQRDEAELRRALRELQHAIENPLGIADRIKQRPLPWIFSGLLIGVWLGGRGR